MSSICGILKKNGKSVVYDDIKKMLNKLNHWDADYSYCKTTSNFGIGKLSFLPIHEDSLLDNSLFISTINPNESAKNKVIKNLLQKDDIKGLKEVEKDFAFAFYKNKELILGRDHLGCKPMYYFENEETIAFSSEIKGLLSIFNIPQKLSEEWLLDTLSNSISDKDKTPYYGIKKLLPGHVLKVTKTKTELIKYWNLDYSEIINVSEQEAVTEFRKRLIKSVDSDSSSNYPVGGELSGGLDSSVVSSLANSYCTKNKNSFYSFSHLNPNRNNFPFKDEEEYIKKVVEHSQIENSIFINSKGKDLISSIDRSLNIMDGPTQQRFYLFSDELYETAKKKNVHTLLSGFGGDEMVSSFAPGYYHELATTNWPQFFIEQLKLKRSANKKIKSILGISVTSKFPEFYNFWLKFAGKERKRITNNLHKNNAIKKEIIKKYDLVERALLKSRFPNQPSVHERQYDRIMHPHVPQRMENSAIAALHNKIEYRYPLLDVKLVEFYYSLPSTFKFKNGIRRYIYRQAIKGIVPDSIRLRNDKSGATIPSVQQRFMNDFENVKTFLINCQKNGIGDEYFDFKKMFDWMVIIKNRNTNKNIAAHQGQFFNFLMLLRFLDKF